MESTNTYSMCRLCLCRNNCFINIFTTNNIHGFVAARVIDDLLRYGVSEDDGYPKVICTSCFSKLTEFKIFKEECQKSKDVYDTEFSPCERLIDPQNNVEIIAIKTEPPDYTQEDMSFSTAEDESNNFCDEESIYPEVEIKELNPGNSGQSKGWVVDDKNDHHMSGREKMQKWRASLPEEKLAEMRKKNAERQARKRQNETAEEARLRKEKDRLRKAKARSEIGSLETRRFLAREAMKKWRATLTEERLAEIRRRDAERRARRRHMEKLQRLHLHNLQNQYSYLQNQSPSDQNPLQSCSYYGNNSNIINNKNNNNNNQQSRLAANVKTELVSVENVQLSGQTNSVQSVYSSNQLDPSSRFPDNSENLGFQFQSNSFYCSDQDNQLSDIRNKYPNVEIVPQSEINQSSSNLISSSSGQVSDPKNNKFSSNLESQRNQMQSNSSYSVPQVVRIKTEYPSREEDSSYYSRQQIV